jgi:Leucine-rich repeat (LRR) protein
VPNGFASYDDGGKVTWDLIQRACFMTSNVRPPTRFRWLLRFSLRTMFLLVTIGCLAGGWFMNRIRHERAAIAWADQKGGYMMGQSKSSLQRRVDEHFEIYPIACLHMNPDAGGDIRPVAHLRGLENFSVYGLPVRDIRAIAGQTELRHLSLGCTKVSDLAPLARMKQLASLDVQETPVSDLSPLAKISGLQRIDMSHTQVTDLTPLAGHSQLEQITLDDTPVTSLRPLHGLKKLKELCLIRCPISEEELVAFKSAVPGCDVLR